MKCSWYWRRIARPKRDATWARTSNFVNLWPITPVHCKGVPVSIYCSKNVLGSSHSASFAALCTALHHRIILFSEIAGYGEDKRNIELLLKRRAEQLREIRPVSWKKLYTKTCGTPTKSASEPAMSFITRTISAAFSAWTCPVIAAVRRVYIKWIIPAFGKTVWQLLVFHRSKARDPLILCLNSWQYFRHAAW